jgi:uncharacterized membrane protein
MSSAKDPTYGIYGTTITASGEASGFSLPFMIFSMIGAGLSWFVAISWSNVFQSAIDDYKKKQEAKGVDTNPVWTNLLMALVSTVLAIAVLYLMVKAYQQVIKVKIPLREGL